MKGFFVFFSCVFFSFWSKALTLEEAQKVASQSNIQIRTQEKEVEARAASLTRSSSEFFPRIGVESRFESFRSEFEKRSGGTANAFAEWNLFNGLQDFSERKARSIDVEISQLRLEKMRQSLSWDVEDKFSRVLSLQRVIFLNKEALEKNEAQKKIARNRHAAGVVSEADVLEFDLFESLLRSELATLEGDLKEAQSQLKVILGTDEISFPLEGELPLYRVNDSIETVLARLPTTNVDLLTKKLEVEKAEALTMFANGGFLPRLDVFATHGSRGLRETEVNPETYYGISARWELFSGFDTIGARRESRAKQVQSEFELRSTQISTKGEAEQRFSKLKALEYRIGLEQTNRGNSEKYFKTVLAEYGRGVKNSPDLRSAAENLLQASVRDIQFRYEFIEQKTALQKLIGSSLDVRLDTSEKLR